MSNLEIKKVPALKKGDVIGIFSSSAPLEEKRFKAGKENLEKLGFKVECPLDPSLYYGKKDWGFSSASIEDRANSINRLFANPDLKVLIAARGGDGALELLPYLNFQELKNNPKILVGFSDVTTLLVQAMHKSSVVSVHGASLGSSFADYAENQEAKKNVDDLISMLSKPDFRIAQSLTVLRAGVAKGRVLAGNLTILLSLLGTPWDIDYGNSILILEDTGEKPYRIYRNLVQLKLAGKLDKISALVFGRFSKAEVSAGPSWDEALSYFLKTQLGQTKFPIFSGLEVGHHGRNLPLALGCQAEIKENKFITLEGAVL